MDKPAPAQAESLGLNIVSVEATPRRRLTLRRAAVAVTALCGVAALAAAFASGAVSMAEVMHPLDAFVKAHGYIGAGVGVGLESLGMPLPGEATVLTVAGVAGHAHNLLGLPLTVGAVWAGGTVGGIGGYGVGRFGNSLKQRLTSSADHGVDDSKGKVARYLFVRYGGRAVVLGRFVPVLRELVGVTAGATRMPFGKFVRCNAAGALIWGAVIGTAGYFLGDSFHHVKDTVMQLPMPAKAALGVVAVGCVATPMVIFKKRFGHWQHEAEKMFPAERAGKAGPVIEVGRRVA